jgi:hypothetical protein
MIPLFQEATQMHPSIFFTLGVAVAISMADRLVWLLRADKDVEHTCVGMAACSLGTQQRHSLHTMIFTFLCIVR